MTLSAQLELIAGKSVGRNRELLLSRILRKSSDDHGNHRGAADFEAGNTDCFNAALTSSARVALERAQKKLYFVADSGSYRALESSGLMSELASTIAHPVLIEAGRPGYHACGIFTAPIESGEDIHFDHVYKNMWIDDGALNVRYQGGQSWAYLYLKYGPIDILFEIFSADNSG